MKLWKAPLFLLLGLAFGLVLTQAQVISVVRIRRMFSFEELHMYLVIGAAVVTGILATALLKFFRKSGTDIGGEKYEVKPRPFQKGIVFGGLMFGLGWYVTAACPGPIYALIGNGVWPAFAILAGSVVGAFLFGWLKPKLKL